MRIFFVIVQFLLMSIPFCVGFCAWAIWFGLTCGWEIAEKNMKVVAMMGMVKYGRS